MVKLIIAVQWSQPWFKREILLMVLLRQASRLLLLVLRVRDLNRPLALDIKHGCVTCPVCAADDE